MISTADLAAWLAANGLPNDALVVFDGDIPEMPDRLVVLTRNGGTGTVRERTFDRGTIQVITRGGQRDAAGAEAFAELVDDLLMGIVGPVEIGAKRVIGVDQEGGPPAFLDRDDAERVLYVCSYLFEVARAVH